MDQASLFILIIAILAAVGMQGYSVAKIEAFIRRTKGIIRYRPDLIEVKEIINLNMKMAIIYIVLFIIFFIIVARIFSGGRPFQAITVLFLFSIITLPLGLIGKHFENKIKSIKIETDDQEIAKTFERYLVMWKEAKWKLPD